MKITLDISTQMLDLLNKAFKKGFEAKKNKYILADFNGEYITQEWIDKQIGLTSNKNSSKFYSIVCNITPFRCEPISYSAVISEDISNLLKRNNNEFQSITLLNIFVISESEYISRKSSNPKSDEYLKMLKKDYSN